MKNLKTVWKKHLKLYSQGDALRSQGNALCSQGFALWETAIKGEKVVWTDATHCTVDGVEYGPGKE